MGRLTEFIGYINDVKQDKYFSQYCSINLYNPIYGRSKRKYKQEVSKFNNRKQDVYFIGNVENAIVKIGKSDCIESRFKQIQPMSPLKLEILKTESSIIKQERDFHKEFSEYRLHGEWFKIDGRLKEFLLDN